MSTGTGQQLELKQSEHRTSLSMEGLNQMQIYPFLVNTGLGFEVMHTFGPRFWNPENALCQHLLKHVMFYGSFSKGWP